MAISFVAASTVVTGSSTTVSYPAGYAKNDLLVWICTSSATVGPPGGFTAVATQSASQFLIVATRIATGDEVTSGFGAGANTKMVMLAYRGAGALQAVPTFLTGTSTAPSTNTLTTTYANDFVLSIYANQNGATRTLTPNASTTSRVSSGTTTTLQGLWVADELRATTGVTVARTATLSASSAWTGLQLAIIEDRTVYWVGGNGTWSTPGEGTTGANWANSSGGAGGVIVPSQNDAVIIDSSSGSPTITLSGFPACGPLTTAGATCTLSSTGTLTVNGSLTLSATTTWSATGTLSITGTGTVTTNAVSITSPITIAGVGQSITLGGTLTTTDILTLTAGTLSLNGNNVTCNSFFSNVNSTRSISFGSNFINVTTGGSVNMPNITNFTNSGTGGFNLTASPGDIVNVIMGSSSGVSFGQNGANVQITGGDATSSASITGGSTLKSLNFTGFSGTYFLENQIRLWGSLILSPTMTIQDNLLNSGIEFRSTTSGNVISTFGIPINLVNFIGVGGSWTLQDALNVATILTLTNGTLNLNGFDASCLTFTGTGTAARGINFGANFVNITDTTTTTVLNAATITLFTPTGTGGFKLTGAAASGITRTVTVGTTGGSVATAPNLFIAAGASGSVVAITNGSWVRDLNFTGFSGTFTAGTNTYNIAGSFTLSNSMLYTISDNSTYNFVATTTGHTINLASPVRVIGNVVFNGVGGGWTLLTDLRVTSSNITLTAGALNLNNFGANCRIWTCTGTVVRSIAFGTSGYVEANSPSAVTSINFADLTNFSYTGTSNIFVAGNAATTATINIGTTGGTEANAMNVQIALGGGTRIFTFATGSVVRDLRLTSLAGTFVPPAALTIFGSLIAGPAGTWTTGTGTITFASTSPGKTITTGGKTLANVTFNGIGGAWSLADALVATNVFTVTNGTFSSNNFNITAQAYTLTGGAIDMGSSTWDATASLTDTVFWNRTGTTINAGTSTIALTQSGFANFTFAGGGATYNTLTFPVAAAQSPIFITGANTFNTLSSARVGNTWQFTLPAGVTTTVGTWGIVGTTAASAFTLLSSTPGVQATLSVASGTVNPNYAYIKDSNATGGATFVSTNAVDLGNNTGWNFTGAAGVLYWVGGSGTWDKSNTANWSNTSGGAGGKPPPNEFVDAFFDANSGSGTVQTLSDSVFCKSLNATGSSFTFSGGPTISIFGDTFTLSPTTVWNVNALGFATPGVVTVTTNGVTLNTTVIQQGNAATNFSLAGNVTVTQLYFMNDGSITLNNNVLTVGAYDQFNVGSIAFGTGSMTVNDPLDSSNDIFSVGPSFSYTGSGIVNVSYSGTMGKTIRTGTTPSEAQSLNINVTTGTYALTIPTNSRFKDLNFTGFAGSCAPPAALTIFGSLTLAPAMTWTTGTGTITFASTSAGRTITTAGKTLNNITFSGVGGTYTLQDNLSSSTISLSGGTLNTNSVDVFCTTIQDVGTNAKTLNLANSTVQVSTSVALNQTNTTVNAGTSTIKLFPVSDSTTFTFNSSRTFNNVVLDRPTAFAAVTFTGSPTITKLSSTRLSDYSILITGGQTLTVEQFDIRGEPIMRYVTVNSTTGTATLASSGGVVQSNIDYVDFFNIIATPTPTATGTTPYVWYIGENSTRTANTTGVVLSSDTSYTYYNLTSGTSWTVPTNWNSTDNNVYLIGGGGGSAGGISVSGAGSKISGAGGGGGGFTALTNVTLTPSGAVSYAIGAAGAAGGSSSSVSTGGAGGTTTFAVTNTAGGGGGGSGTTTTSTAGTAGTGTTNNGGAGAAGTFDTNISRAGSGGGGSGGLNGAGIAGSVGGTVFGGFGGAGNNGINDYLVGVLLYGDGGRGASSSSVQPGNPGLNFGGGAGGGSVIQSSTADSSGTAGTQGAILIRYRTGTPPSTATGNFLNFFYQ